MKVKRYKRFPANGCSKILILLVGILILCGLSFASLSSIGCTKKKGITDVVNDNTTYISIWLSSRESTAFLRSNTPLDTSSADVLKSWNDSSLKFPDKYLSPDKKELFFWDSTNNTYGTTYTIFVTSDYGTATGSCVFPDMTHIIQPQHLDTLLLDDIIVIWTTVHGADFYKLILDTRACDSSGSYIAEYYFDTLLTCTSSVIPSTHFDVYNASYYKINLTIRSYAGAQPIPEAPPNMQGSLRGFLTAQGNNEGFQFFVIPSQFNNCRFIGSLPN